MEATGAGATGAGATGTGATGTGATGAGATETGATETGATGTVTLGGGAALPSFVWVAAALLLFLGVSFGEFSSTLF